MGRDMDKEKEAFEKLSEMLDAETIDIRKDCIDRKIKIILIGHKKRQGKDTFSSMLKENLEMIGVKTEQLSFAEPMKEIVAEALGVNIETLDHMKNNSEHYRGMLQRFGSGLMKKNFGDTVWRDIALNRIREIEKDGVECVIISDFRFPCEYIECAITINVVRDTCVANDEHISETALDGFDYDCSVFNVWSLEILNQKANEIAHKIYKGEL